MYSIHLCLCRRLTAMNAPMLPEVFLGVQPADQSTLNLATEGVPALPVAERVWCHAD